LRCCNAPGDENPRPQHRREGAGARRLGPEPLFIKFYEVRQAPEQSVLGRDWKILKLLAANGADLSAPDAAPFAADLRKTEVPLYDGLYIDLK
jgi:hypothetical protein